MLTKSPFWITGGILFVIALVLLHVLTSRTPPPTFDQVVKAFDKWTTESEKQQSSEVHETAPKGQPSAKDASTESQRQLPLHDADIYVNLSQSMRGFVAVSNANSRISPGSNYRRVLETLADRMSTRGGYTVRKYRFSQHSDVPDISYFLEPAHYTDSPVPLAQVLGQWVLPAFDSNRLTLVVSDMVASGTATAGPGPDASACFRELKRNHPQAKILLLGFRSAYDGAYRASALACLNRQFEVSANQSLPGSGRPFYMMVIAPDASSLKYLWDSVLAQLGGRASFDPSGNPLPWETGPADNTPGYNFIQINRRQGDSDIPRRFYSILALSNEVTVRFRWRTNKDSDDDPSLASIVDPSRLDLRVDALYFDRSANVLPAPRDLLRVKPFADGDKNNVVFEYSLQPPTGHPWAVYRVSVRPGAGNLQLGPRLLAWSSNDDCTPASAKTTLKLNLLGEALDSSFTQDTVFDEQYIAIRRD